MISSGPRGANSAAGPDGMADPGHDNDFQDLGSFDDDSSVISVSATSPGISRWGWRRHQRLGRPSRLSRGTSNSANTIAIG